jgi:hypothetical protein
VNSAEPMRLSVRDPSSMILQVMWPSLSISPDFAETKFMGRRGIFMLAIACRASSSMIVLVSLVLLVGLLWGCSYRRSI